MVPRGLKLGSSRNRVGGVVGKLRRPIEFTAEESDPGAIVGEAAEAAGIGLDDLDLRVEALGEGVGDGMLGKRPAGDLIVSEAGVG